MNYRPYPDTDRALAQVERHLAPKPHLAWVDEIMAPLKLTDWQRALLDSAMTVTLPKRSGRTAITTAITDQAVKDGEHVHVATRDGIRCAGGDDDCTRPRAGAAVIAGVGGLNRAAAQAGAFAEQARRICEAIGLVLCPHCGHVQHAPGAECAAVVDHDDKHRHRCLCLNLAGMDRPCPPQMDCQGGTLGYADIEHLRAGGILRGKDGVTITPDVLPEPQNGADR